MPHKVLYSNIDSCLYVIDLGNYKIRKMNTIGVITTICGDGTVSNFGDGGPASAAELYNPVRMVFDTVGNLYIGCYNRVRKISTTGYISSVDSGYGATGITFDTHGNLYTIHYDSALIYKMTPAGLKTKIAGNGLLGFSGDGGSATAAMLYQPYSLAFDHSGNLLIADMHNNRIRMVDTLGIITTIAGNGTGGMED